MGRLTELQLDALREICSIGAGNAATAVSQMVNRRITLSVPAIRLVPITEAARAIGDPQALIAGVYCKVMGELSGGFILTFPREIAFTLSDMLLNVPAGKTRILDELGKSALQEMGNVVIGAFVAALAKILNKSMLMSVPKFAFDMAGAVIDFILVELAEVAEQALVMEIVFSDVNKTIDGRFFVLADPGSLKILLSVVKEYDK